MKQKTTSKMFPTVQMEAVTSKQDQTASSKSCLQNAINDCWAWRPSVILPHTRWYTVFWYFTMVFALANAILEPYKVAFGAVEGFLVSADFWSVTEYMGAVVFFVDIVLKFYVAYEDTDNRRLVTDLQAIRLHYLKLFFWLDLLFWFPFVNVICTARPDLSSPGNTSYSEYLKFPYGSNTAMYIGLLNFLKLGRLYRIFHLFAELEHSMVMSQMALMLTRNFFYILLTCHWFACIFFYMARMEDFAPDRSWVGRHVERFEGKSPPLMYVLSFYVSVVSFTSLGDNDLYSNSPAESIVMSIYLLFNVVLGAYILGTVTMLMVKGDVRSSMFRDRIANLKDYSNVNDIPKDLHDAMRKHIDLHFQSELAADELVLQPYPEAMKKRVLRHLYLEPLRDCYLFTSCKAKFLDAILAICRTELFMPNVQIITEGDIVADLYVVIDGEVEVVPMMTENSSSGPATSRMSMTLGIRRSSNLGLFSDDITPSRNANPSFASSVGRTHKQADRRGTSEAFGEVAFFTETPSTEAVYTTSVSKVLVLPRAAYEKLLKAYPNQVRLLLGSIVTRTTRGMLTEINDVLELIPQSQISIHTRLEAYMEGDVVITTDLPAPLVKELKGLFNTDQIKKWEQLELIRASYERLCANQNQQHLLDMFFYAEHGQAQDLITILNQGVNPSAADFDRRTPLMVAARQGQEVSGEM